MNTKLLKFSLILFLGSCATISRVAPPYTNVEKIAQLKMGTTLAVVNSTLAIPPYNILNMQEDGSGIYAYNYRIKIRNAVVPSGQEGENVLHSEQYNTMGDERYSDEVRTVLAVFKEGKLSAIHTTEGWDKAEYLMLIDDNLKLLSKQDLEKLDVLKVGNDYIAKKGKLIKLIKN